MYSKSSFKKNTLVLACLALTLSIFIAGCGKKSEETGPSPSQKLVIQNSGSDTMVNLAQGWAEKYAIINPSVSVEVSGGGSGTGIAGLINGTVDLANCSRLMEPEEIERAKKNMGKEPVKFVVGYDALAVYIHKDNPLDQISIEQLAQIYGEGGKITKWSQLGIKNTACPNDEIIRVSRQSNSGTYFYFRETLLGKERDFKLGSRDLHGSKDVVELVGGTPCAIGYSGMGYATDRVKKLKISRETGKPAYEPSMETELNGTYPISRPLQMYTLGEPTGEIRKYIEWIYSDVGQAIVEQSGYVPLPQREREADRQTLEGSK
jgi:phosphate transport system substrate-binding protein